MDYWALINSIAIATVTVGGGYIVTRKIEDLKSKYSRQQFIHKLQFEKEFEIYLKLWKELVDFRISTERLIKSVEMIPENMTEKEYKKKKLEALHKHFQTLHDTVKKHKPFYSEEVFKDVQEIKDIAVTQLRFFHFPDQDTLKHYKDAEDRIGKINSIADRIEKSIRDRIVVQENSS